MLQPCRQPRGCWQPTARRSKHVAPAQSVFPQRLCSSRPPARNRQQAVRVRATAEAERAVEQGPKGRPAGTAIKDMNVNESGMRELPVPADFQQTLVHSFTMGGMGLHTAEYATVRVRPAYAGEGRYFVRVPEGTNKNLFVLYGEPEPIAEEDLVLEEELDPEVEAAKVGLYMEYLRDQEDTGFDGTFEQWVYDLDSWDFPFEREKVAGVNQEQMQDAYEAAADDMDNISEDDLLDTEVTPVDPEDEPEEIVPLDPEDPTLMAAHITNVKVVGMPFQQLGANEDANRVIGAEFLLAALEACGVDNARIEIEGGHEVPILDHTALGWCLEIQQAGLRPAPISPDVEDHEGLQPGALVQRPAFKPTVPYTTQHGDAWVSVFPGDWIKLSAGVDHEDGAAIIGQQWYSWRYSQDLHFRFELAPARGYAETLDELFALRAAGYCKMGAENMYIIGHGTRWWDPQMVRFPRDECARHKLVQLIGDLALMADPGGSGLPVGHVVAFQADHELHIDFMREFLTDVGEEARTTTEAVLNAQDEYRMVEQEEVLDEAEAAGPPKPSLFEMYDVEGEEEEDAGEGEQEDGEEEEE